MRITARDGKRLLTALIIAGFIYLIVSTTISGMRASHEREANKEVQRWLGLAREDVKPNWTEDDAVSWFEQHGFEPIRKKQGVRIVIGKSKGQFPLVDAYRPIEGGGLVAKRYWVRIAFFFDEENKFRSVEGTAWPFDPAEHP
jgi:hypothetical protein